jgi:S1-C subfamily serine protease
VQLTHQLVRNTTSPDESSMSQLPTATQWVRSAAPSHAQQAIDAVAMVVVNTTALKGTGWLVNDHMVVTNEHVIRGGAPGGIVVNFPNGSTSNVVRVPVADVSLDLAVLELQAAPGVSPLKIAQTDLTVGVQIYALGFPLAYNGPAPLMIVGYVAGFEARSPQVGYPPQKRVVLNATVNPGNSGGPVLPWNKSSVAGVVVSKHAPISSFLEQAIDALASNRSGIVFNYTDGQGNVHPYVESQLVADILKYFRGMTQVVIGEAIPANDVAALLTARGIPWTPDRV